MRIKSRKNNNFVIRLGGKILYLKVRTYIMGVINRTPDSFSKDGLYLDDKEALKRIESFKENGCDILDIGGESTRPGSLAVDEAEEIKRTIPFIRTVKRRFDLPISIDTTKSKVAELALSEGACVVNDTSGLKKDPEMARVIARHNAAVVLMHCKGEPKTMQENPAYKDLIKEIIKSLRESIKIALRAGIKENRIIIDPGIGFGKTTAHNLEILKNLDKFGILDKPILIGVSRKSFIGKVLDLPVEERIFGTAASVAWAVSKGANIIRVHDVKEMAQVTKLIDAIKKA